MSACLFQPGLFMSIGVGTYSIWKVGTRSRYFGCWHPLACGPVRNPGPCSKCMYAAGYAHALSESAACAPESPPEHLGDRGLDTPLLCDVGGVCTRGAGRCCCSSGHHIDLCSRGCILDDPQRLIIVAGGWTDAHAQHDAAPAAQCILE